MPIWKRSGRTCSARSPRKRPSTPPWTERSPRPCRNITPGSKKKNRMPALIDLRRRIRSVQNTQQITQAMKTVSTAKFKKAQRTVLEGRPQWHDLPGLLEKIASWAGRQASPLLDRRERRKFRALIVTSEKGICGAFNSNLLGKAQGFLEGRSAHCEIGLVLAGKKAG